MVNLGILYELVSHDSLIVLRIANHKKQIMIGFRLFFEPF